jgi:hypothetical protein
MTQVIGLKCYDVIVLAGEKISHEINPSGWCLAFAGIGKADYLQQAGEMLMNHFRTPEPSAVMLTPTLRSILSEIYQQPITATKFPTLDEPGFDMVFAANYQSDLFLMEIRHGAVLGFADYTYLGEGRDYAKHLLEGFYGFTSMHGTVSLALFALQRTRSYLNLDPCGAEVFILCRDGRSALLTHSMTAPLVRILGQMDGEVEVQFFKSLLLDKEGRPEDMTFLAEKTVEVRRQILTELDRLFIRLNLAQEVVAHKTARA